MDNNFLGFCGVTDNFGVRKYSAIYMCEGKVLMDMEFS